MWLVTAITVAFEDVVTFTGAVSNYSHIPCTAPDLVLMSHHLITQSSAARLFQVMEQQLGFTLFYSSKPSSKPNSSLGYGGCIKVY